MRRLIEQTTLVKTLLLLPPTSSHPPSLTSNQRQATRLQVNSLRHITVRHHRRRRQKIKTGHLLGVTSKNRHHTSTDLHTPKPVTRNTRNRRTVKTETFTRVDTVRTAVVAAAASITKTSRRRAKNSSGQRMAITKTHPVARRSWTDVVAIVTAVTTLVANAVTDTAAVAVEAASLVVRILVVVMRIKRK